MTCPVLVQDGSASIFDWLILPTNLRLHLWQTVFMLRFISCWSKISESAARVRKSNSKIISLTQINEILNSLWITTQWIWNSFSSLAIQMRIYFERLLNARDDEEADKKPSPGDDSSDTTFALYARSHRTCPRWVRNFGEILITGVKMMSGR